MWILQTIACAVWRAVSALVPKDDALAVVSTFPEFDDTLRALCRTIKSHNLKLVVLTKARVPVPEWVLNQVRAVYTRRSIAGILAYHRARFVFYTHNLYGGLPLCPQQCVVNVWHGMPLKNVGLLDTKRVADTPRFSYTIADDRRYQDIMAAVFGVAKDRVLIAGHPRLDILFTPEPASKLGTALGSRYAMWLPTYRRAVCGDVRDDGAVDYDGIDINSIYLADRLFDELGLRCLLKEHAMSRVLAPLKGLRAISIVSDSDLQTTGDSLYSLLAGAAFLITDLSSVYWDYRRTGRPTLVFCTDKKQYEENRGFVAPFQSLVDGPIYETFSALEPALRRAADTPVVVSRPPEIGFVDGLLWQIYEREGLLRRHRYSGEEP